MKANIGIGFVLNYGVNLLILPILFDKAHPALSAFWIGCVFTVVSVVRQLVIRRWFNGLKFGNTKDEAIHASPSFQAIVAMHEARVRALAGNAVPVESLGREHA